MCDFFVVVVLHMAMDLLYYRVVKKKKRRRRRSINHTQIEAIFAHAYLFIHYFCMELSEYCWAIVVKKYDVKYIVFIFLRFSDDWIPDDRK